MDAPLPDSTEQPLTSKPPYYHSYLLRFGEERSLSRRCYNRGRSSFGDEY